MKYIDQLEAHGPAVQRLIESKHQNRCHHALLFCGPSGIGKKLAAKAFCQGVICEQAKEAPCGSCNPCRKVYEGIHPDILTVGAEGRSETVKIASIRSIQTFLSKTRNEGSCSVVVIQDADTMNAESQNALLKVLEEPMPNVYFVLISDSTENMLETVLSRCHLIQFKTLNPEQLSKILSNSGFSEQEEKQLITLAEGSAGRAISIGRAGIGQTVPAILDLLDEINSRNIVSEFLTGSDKDQDLIILDLIVMLLRDIMSVSTQSAEIRYFPQYEERIVQLAQRLPLEVTESLMQTVSNAQGNYRNSFNSKLTINSMLTDMGISIT